MDGTSYVSLNASRADHLERFSGMLLQYESYPFLNILAIIVSSLFLGKLLGSARTFHDTVVSSCAILAWNWRFLIVQIWSRTLYRASAFTATFSIVGVVLFKAFSKHDTKPSNSSVEPQTDFLLPALLPCRTTHARLLPTKHSFSYSYLFVGIPIGWNGSAGKLLSTDRAKDAHTWFTVHSDDYLSRGHHPKGLAGKLEEFLSSQGVAKGKYPRAYLVTAPRFLGYSFNPVSFWYLYDQQSTLTAMILEVNNTFDERRIYLLQNSGHETDDSTFRSVWNKDFHVSPFNDREGSYSATVKNPMLSSDSVNIDNNIVLRSSDEKAKIVARIYSEVPGKAAAKFSRFDTWRFVLSWWWVGFMTNPRIIKEARTLWVKKLQVFYRPEVLSTSIGRQATAGETIMEPFFRAYLQRLLDRSGHSKLIYQPALGPDGGNVVILQSVSRQLHDIEQEINFRVLTPAFYRAVAVSGSIDEAFTRFCISPGAGEKMVVSSRPSHMHQLISCTQSDTESNQSESLVLERIVAALCRKSISSAIRLIPRLIHTQTTTMMEQSDLDTFVKAHFSNDEYRYYLKVKLRLLLVDKLAFGVDSLFGLYITCIRLGASTAIARIALSGSHLCGHMGQCLQVLVYLFVLHTLAGV